MFIALFECCPDSVLSFCVWPCAEITLSLHAYIVIQWRICSVHTWRDVFQLGQTLPFLRFQLPHDLTHLDRQHLYKILTWGMFSCNKIYIHFWSYKKYYITFQNSNRPLITLQAEHNYGLKRMKWTGCTCDTASLFSWVSCRFDEGYDTSCCSFHFT